MSKILIVLACLLTAQACGKKTSEDNSEFEFRNQLIIQENAEIVGKARDLMEEGQTIKVAEQVEDYCGGVESHYRIHKIGGNLSLAMRLKLTAHSSLNEKMYQAGFKQTTACLPSIAKFFKQYDVDLYLEFLKSDDYSYADSTVILTGVDERSNSRLFSLKDPNYCRMVLHEVGHHFGLRDEYYEAGTCRTKEVKASDVDPFSIMELHYEKNVALFPRHFKTILGPVFDPKEETTFPILTTAEAFGGKEFRLLALKDLYWDASLRYRGMRIDSSLGLKSCYFKHDLISSSRQSHVVKKDTYVDASFESETIKLLSSTRALDGRKKNVYDVLVKFKLKENEGLFNQLECHYYSRQRGVEGLQAAVSTDLKVEPVFVETIAKNVD